MDVVLYDVLARFSLNSSFISGSSHGGFSFRVDDGVNYARRERFEIESKPLVLKLENMKTLETYPGILQPITPEVLMAKTNDKLQFRPISFTLQTKPQNGKLVWASNTTSGVVTFNQKDIDNGMIAYEHHATMGSWSQEDSFTFDVSTAYAQSLTFKTFKIVISYENINDDNKDQLIQFSGLEVQEGGSAVLGKTNLDLSLLRRRLGNSGLRNPEVHYALTEPPMHGTLIVDEANATAGTTFTQRDVNRGKVQYTHDHSDTLWDAFKFNVEIEVSGTGAGARDTKPSRQSNVFNITVQPVNDQEFKLQTNSPEIRLVQGFTAPIMRKQLNTTDPDTPPEGIIYEIMNGPDNGKVVLARNPDDPITKFTQKDVNDDEVIFVHDGSMGNGAFYFSVTDGSFNPYFKVFKIIVDPLTLELMNITSITLLQGHASAFLAPENIQVETNGRREKIIFNVTQPPSFGQLYMRDHLVYQFSQRNVDNREISYIQTDMSSGLDHFEFIVYDSQNMLRNQKLNISVRARVEQNLVNARPGGTITFSPEVLDASDLAKNSRRSPKYDIIKPPSLGKLFKMRDRMAGEKAARGKRDAARKSKKGKGRQREESEESDEVEASSFTHDDIVRRRIIYRPNPSNASHDRTDSFTYRLTADNSQPATNTFYIRVRGVPPPGSTYMPIVNGVTSKPVNSGQPASTEPHKTPPPIDPNKTDPTTTPAYSMDRLIVIILVSGITVLVVMGLIIMRCFKMRRKRREKLEKAKEDSRTPLAQPNVHIEPQKMNMAPYHDDPDVGRMREASSVPVINVTPDTPQMYEHHRSPPPRPRSRSRSKSPSASRSNHSLTRPSSAPKARSRSRSPPTYRRQGPIPVATPTVPTGQRSNTLPSAGAGQMQTEAEVSRTVPTCKVTPLFDGEGVEVRTPGGTLTREQVSFDWENVDPELLQHCRTTNPVLHENKYWV